MSDSPNEDIHNEDNIPTTKKSPKQQQQNQQPPSTRPQNLEPKKRRFPFFWVIGFFVALLAALYVAGKSYYCFYFIDHRHYATSFYTWRINFADKLMYNETWKLVKQNTYDEKTEDGKFAPFIDDMQNKDVPLLFDLHPEHYVRGQKFYFTHSNIDGNEYNNHFLDFRKEIIKRTGTSVSEKIKKGEQEVNEAKDIKFFNKYEEKKEEVDEKGEKKNPSIVKWTEEDYKNIFKDNKHEEVKKFMGVFTRFLVDIWNGELTKSVGEKVSDKTVTRIKELLAAAEVKIDDKTAEEAPILFGSVKSGMLHNFFYSRMFYMFFLSTLDVELDYGKAEKDAIAKDDQGREKKIKDIDNKIIKEGERMRIIYVSKVFAQILCKIFTINPTDKDFDSKTEMSWLDKTGFSLLGPAKFQQFVLEKDNIELLLKKLEERYDVK